MYEATREQEAKIAAMALEHGSVAAEVFGEEGLAVVKATAGGRTWLIDEDGNVAKAPPEHVSVKIPTSVLRQVVGDEDMDALIAGLDENDAFPEHTLGRKLEGSVLAALMALVA